MLPRWCCLLTCGMWPVIPEGFGHKVGMQTEGSTVREQLVKYWGGCCRKDQPPQLLAGLTMSCREGHCVCGCVCVSGQLNYPDRQLWGWERIRALRGVLLSLPHQALRWYFQKAWWKLRLNNKRHFFCFLSNLEGHPEKEQPCVTTTRPPPSCATMALAWSRLGLPVMTLLAPSSHPSSDAPAIRWTDLEKHSCCICHMG